MIQSESIQLYITKSVLHSQQEMQPDIETVASIKEGSLVEVPDIMQWYMVTLSVAKYMM